MAINKVIYGADTLVDLTEDTVTAEDVLNSKSFHTPDGVQRTGTASYPVTDVQVNGTSVMDGTIAKVAQPTGEVKTATDTFTTVNGGLLEECNIELEPVQDLHGYDSPWVGGAGKNKCDNSTNTGGYYDASGNYSASDDYRTSALIEVSANTDYTASLFDTSDNSRVAGLVYTEWDASQNFIQQVANVLTITTGATTKYLRLRNYNAQTALVKSNHYAYQLEQGSSATAFEPYSNICPISGHTEVDLLSRGINQWDEEWEVGAINGATGQPSEASTVIRSKNYCPVSANATLYIKSPQDVYIYWYSSSSYGYISYNYVVKNTTVTAPANATYFKIQITSAYGTTYNNDVSINYPSTDHDYHPYLGHLYQVQIGSTVYGGYVDLVSGVMRVDRASVDLGTLTWTKDSSKTFFALITNSLTGLQDMRCEVLNPYPKNYMLNNYNNYPDNIIARNNTQKYVYVKCTTYEDGTASDFRTAMSGYKLVYELATPQTIQLTPQQIEALVGQNNLSTPLSGQSIDSVEYREVFVFDDVEKVVSLRVPISMLGTDESGRTTASQAYASGDYFYKDGYMCKALTSISAGATLTLNTNYSQGTLADILKAIENA